VIYSNKYGAAQTVAADGMEREEKKVPDQPSLSAPSLLLQMEWEEKRAKVLINLI
jgi:hypothetical protein